MSEPAMHEVSKELTRRPREQMNTHQAKHEGALDKFRADTERFRTDMAQRESSRMQWLIGMWIGGVLVTIAALGVFIRLAIRRGAARGAPSLRSLAERADKASGFHILRDARLEDLRETGHPASFGRVIAARQSFQSMISRLGLFSKRHSRRAGCWSQLSTSGILSDQKVWDAPLLFLT